MQQRAFTALYVLAESGDQHAIYWDGRTMQSDQQLQTAFFCVFLSCSFVQEQPRAGNFGLGTALCYTRGFSLSSI